jgi:hypothetical protein
MLTKLERKRLVEKPKRGYENNIKIHLKETKPQSVNWNVVKGSLRVEPL